MIRTPVVTMHGGAGAILHEAMKTKTEAQYPADRTAVLCDATHFADAACFRPHRENA